MQRADSSSDFTDWLNEVLTHSLFVQPDDINAEALGRRATSLPNAFSAGSMMWLPLGAGNSENAPFLKCCFTAGMTRRPGNCDSVPCQPVTDDCRLGANSSAWPN